MTTDTLPAALRRWRQRAGLSQCQLAERAGLSANAVSALERGTRRAPYPRTMRALAAALALAPTEAESLTRLARAATASTPPSTRTADVPAPRQLPAPHAGFTGREAEFAALDALLPHGQAPAATAVCAISGTAGVGKTALAIAWAHRVRDRFPAGQLYVDLRGYDPGTPADPADVLDGFLRSLDVPTELVPPTTAGRTALFRSRTDGARLLVVLDNARDADQVRPLLPGSARALVLVTSRDSLTGLAVTCGARRVPLGLLPTADAERLLRALVGARRAAAEPVMLTELGRLCGRLPLALQLGGQRAAAHAHLPLGAVVASLADERERFASLSRGADAPSTVRAVFSWSFRDLPESSARLFRLLGTAPGRDVDARSAAALAGCSPAEVLGQLDALVDAHLIATAQPGRFQMHDLLRAYAAELADPGDQADALRRLGGLYLHGAATADRALNPARDRVTIDAAPAQPSLPAFADAREALAWCDRELANLVAVVHAAAKAGLPDLAWQLANCLWSYFYLTKRHTEWTSTHEVGLAAAEAAGSLAGRARMLNGLAPAAPLPRARELLNAAYELFDRAGDPHGAASALVNLADAELRAGNYAGAAAYSEQALTRLATAASPYVQAAAVCNLGEAYQALGRHADAVATFTRAHDLCERHGNRVGATMALVHLGEVHAAAGRYAEAVLHLEKGLARCRESGDRRSELRGLLTLADVHVNIGAARAARRCWEQALPLLEAVGDDRAAEVRRALQAGPPRSVLATRLTPAEERVAGLAAGGLTNREVASIVRLSPKTVELNLSRVYQKLGVRNRTELANLLRASAHSPAPAPA